ncbi:hypothetical protein OROMI_002920 [Orobanche minor]
MLLLSAGLVSTLVLSSLMRYWDSIKCLLSSHLYICIIINLMVVLIAASSTFHGRHDSENRDDHQIKMISFHLDDHDPHIPKSQPPPPPPDAAGRIIPPSPSEAHSHDLSEPIKENPATTCLHDPLLKNTAIAKEHEEEDTMEATWRSITGGGRKQNPTKKQLKKCETWDETPQNNISLRYTDSEELLPSSNPKWKGLRKSETFNDADSATCRGGVRGGGLRRDPSTSLEEFNKQVEEFIKRFNDDMKLQRQESDQRLLDMMKRGL